MHSRSASALLTAQQKQHQGSVMRIVPFQYLALAAAILSCSSVYAATLEGGAVAAPDQYGAQVAADILKKGGNAVDAAVATAFTLAVTYPEAGNIGGGGFMTLFVDGKPYFLDYREVAPKAATRNMYLDDKGEVIENLSLVGARAAGVPGTVMGLWEAHQKFGKLPWSELLTPAIGYAKNGFKVAEKQYQYRNDAQGMFKTATNFNDYFGNMKVGELFKQPEMAQTLERIADKGVSEFYQGKTADLLVAQMQADKGLITKDDLKDYKAVWREPMAVSWRGNVVYTAPPPSSGGVALAQLLGIKEDRAADFKGVAHNSAQYIHLLAEIEKRVFADRADYLGDPAFTKVPVDQLVAKDYLAKRAAQVNPKAISDTDKVKPGLEPHQTTHFSIVDKQGNAVSNTYTLNLDYGSGVVVKGAGFLLNDEMDDFSAKPGAANAFGVVGGDANAIEPGKRMLSSMSPSLMTRDGKVELVIGTPGGSRIFTSIFQVMNNLYDYGMKLDKAVAAQRVHHQLLPKDTIYFDSYAPLTGPVADELKKMGYVLEDQGWEMGDIQAIRVDGAKLETASDPRGRGVGMIVK
ncbi:gamma-glutamyltransferase [Pseudomonas putida ND6]|uniref:Glutathione hydrolase proenzyme n=2 Tax=Pseudomonas putida TaxID=303 RepID=I3USR7_PSEPU|nr:gamma-glutamyltransferase [Pseudomonas putida ND6]